MLHVVSPPTYGLERKYVYSVVLRDLLGLDYRLETAARSDVSIVNDSADESELLVSDVLFQTPAEKWLTRLSLPPQPCRSCAVDKELSTALGAVRVVYGTEIVRGRFLRVGASKVILGLDIFGTIFFMLTRYEEVVKGDRDRFGRFPAAAALAYQEGFLNRPIVNEHVEILWRSMHRLWPSLKRKEPSFRLFLTHDVDEPLCAGEKPSIQTLRATLGDVVKRADISMARRRLCSLVQARRGNFEVDMYNTFDLIMDLSEAVGTRSAFYFIADSSSAGYSLRHPWMKKLLRRIGERGHEIGLHGSYTSFDDPAQLAVEFALLREACESQGIQQSTWGGRQHYLRWDARSTWLAWERAGLAYDSSVGFSEQAGFRCGICDEFPTFDIRSRTALALRERPLAVMEVSLLRPDYMGLSHRNADKVLADLANTCAKFLGQFTLLWHNSSLVSKRDIWLYRQAVQHIAHLMSTSEHTSGAR